MSEIMMYSDVESKRFGLRVFRGLLKDIDSNGIEDELRSNEVDVAILRIPAENLRQVCRLEELGFSYLVADTLVYYYVNLETYNPSGIKNADLAFVESGLKNQGTMAELAGEIFTGYINHYSANYLFKTEDILEGFKEWASSYAGSAPGRISWLAQRDQDLMGFMACSYDDVGKQAGIVLNGVRDALSGRGIYSDMIRFTQGYFKERGYTGLKVSTQVQNYAAQRVWSREGFILREAYITLHINSLLNHRKSPSSEAIY